MAAKEQPPIILCRSCTTFKARTTCMSCNNPICLNCERNSGVGFRITTDKWHDNYDYEWMRRCIQCDTDNRLPVIRYKADDTSCIIS